MQLLLHACCADCTLKFLSTTNHQDIAIYYYNPNIHPRSEYQERLKAIQKIALENKVKLVIPNWQPKDYFLAQQIGRGTRRCINCWNLRLQQSADYAKSKGYSHLSTTLLTSHYQDQDKVKEIGNKICSDIGIGFFIPETICQDLHTSGFYKQSYCGCCYSLVERLQEKFTQ